MSTPTLKTYTCLHSILIPSSHPEPIYNPSLLTLPTNATHRPYRSPCPLCQPQTTTISLLPTVPLTTRIHDATQQIRSFFLSAITRYLNAGNAYFDIELLIRARIAADVVEDENVGLAVQQFELERRKWNADPFFAAWVGGYEVLRDCGTALQQQQSKSQAMTAQQERELVWRINALRGEIPGILARLQGLEDGVRKMQEREGMEGMRVRMKKGKELKKMGTRQMRSLMWERERMALRREAGENAGYAAWKRRVEGVEEMGG